MNKTEIKELLRKLDLNIKYPYKLIISSVLIFTDDKKIKESMNRDFVGSNNGLEFFKEVVKKLGGDDEFIYYMKNETPRRTRIYLILIRKGLRLFLSYLPGSQKKVLQKLQNYILHANNK